ncbi:MAG: hypothetical protein KAT43_00685 [Nanoarchaeota archaeon]|nr:hypothetical protein [Nanoarchaeota archaeon]
MRKIKKKTVWFLLILVFLAVLAFRLYFAFQSNNFSPDAYFDLRQINAITDTRLPIYHDTLSYGGRDFLFLPVFHYILAGFSFFIPISLAGKILPNIFAAALIFIVYLISKHITKNTGASLFTALISGFIPIYISSTLNTVSPHSLQIPLIFLALYTFMRQNQKRFVIFFVILTFLLPLIHLSSLILIFAFFIYTFLAYLERFQYKARTLELVLFFTFITLWISLLVYKDAFLVHGPSLIWQNIPASVLTQYFQQITFVHAISGIGIFPLIIGCYVLYKYMFQEKRKDVYLLTSLAISVALLLWLKLITLNLGLSILGIVLILLFGLFYKIFFDYINKTRAARLASVSFLVIVLIFLVTSIIPSIIFAATTETANYAETDAIAWLNEESGKQTSLLAPIRLGHIITYGNKIRNVADTNFLMAPIPEQRLIDINTVYSTPIEIEAIEIMDNYDVTHLYVPEGVEIKYITDACFDLVYDEKVKIYELECGTVTKRRK